jgi:hypothetical protein
MEITPEDIANYKNELDVIDEVNKIKRDNIRLCLRIQKDIGEVGQQTILAIKKHRCLLNRFLITKCKKYSDISQAIANVSPQEILINLSELNLYGVFDMDSYFQFIDNLRDDMSSDESVVYNPTQVILDTWPQKIVFMCSYDVTNRIKEYAKRYFHSEIDVVSNNNVSEITIVNSRVNNQADAQVKYKEFVHYVNKNLSNVTEVQSLNLSSPCMLYIDDKKEKSYYLTRLNNHVDNIKSVTDLFNVFKGGNIINVTINNYNYQVNNDNVTNHTKEWIKNNPPEVKEQVNLYYDRYASGGGELNRISFGKIVKMMGYANKHSGSHRYYSKC